jgi:hypothetical protein
MCHVSRVLKVSSFYYHDSVVIVFFFKDKNLIQLSELSII